MAQCMGMPGFPKTGGRQRSRPRDIPCRLCHAFWIKRGAQGAPPMVEAPLGLPFHRAHRRSCRHPVSRRTLCPPPRPRSLCSGQRLSQEGWRVNGDRCDRQEKVPFWKPTIGDFALCVKTKVDAWCDGPFLIGPGCDRWGKACRAGSERPGAHEKPGRGEPSEGGQARQKKGWPARGVGW